MNIARNLIYAATATAIASSAAMAMSPNAAADPAAPPAPVPAQQLPGLPALPALTELSPIIQQAAGNPEQATQLLMAAAQAFSKNPSAPAESKNVAASVNQFAQAPEAASTAHVVPPGVEPGAQAHLPTGIDPVHAAGPAPAAAPAAGTRARERRSSGRDPPPRLPRPRPRRRHPRRRPRPPRVQPGRPAHPGLHVSVDQQQLRGRRRHRDGAGALGCRTGQDPGARARPPARRPTCSPRWERRDPPTCRSCR